MYMLQATESEMAWRLREDSRSASLASLCIMVLAGACGSESEPWVEDCSIEGQKRTVLDIMREAYLWEDEMPVVDLADYETPEEVLDALRYRREEGGESVLVDRYSRISQQTEFHAFYEEGQMVDAGFTTMADATGALRVAFVFEGTPAAQRELRRGDTILGVNGKTVEEIQEQELWDIAGPDEPGVKVRYDVRHLDGSEETLEVEKALITIDTVQTTSILDSTAGKVGYLHLTSFIGPTEAALREAFATFQAEGVSELVLDMRYNGGGRLNVAVLLGSLIGGKSLANEPLCRLTHNDQLRDLDGDLTMAEEPEAIGVTRLVTLADRGTASASEVVINGLEPFMDVRLVGDTTYGKAVGSESFKYCDQVLSPITFVLENAEGFGDYHFGLAPDCPVADDLEHQLGDAAEARLAAALSWLETGECERPATDAPEGAATTETVRNDSTEGEAEDDAVEDAQPVTGEDVNGGTMRAPGLRPLRFDGLGLQLRDRLSRTR